MSWCEVSRDEISWDEVSWGNVLGRHGLIPLKLVPWFGCEAVEGSLQAQTSNKMTPSM